MANPEINEPLSTAVIQQMAKAERLRLELEEALEDEREKHYSKTARKLMKRTEDKITPKMKARRDAFINEYIVDFNGPAAVIRSGGAICTAPKMSSEFLREPYVLSRVKALIDAMEEANLINRKRILAGLIMEANFHGMSASHGARVTAWKTLADILGMEAPKTVKNEHLVKGGVMMVPMAGSAKEWEEAAARSQSELKEEVRK